MDWSKGFTSTYYAYVVNPISWKETERFQITGGSIVHENDALRESADISCKGYELGKEQWIRIYLDARQKGSAAHVPLFTGLACSPSRDIDGLYITNTLQCYSVFKPAQDVLLMRGYYIPAGMNGAEAVKDLLSVIPAPVIIEGASPSVTTSIIAEDGETRLSMADKVLQALGWRLRITGSGTVIICEKAKTSSCFFDAVSHDSIEPQVSMEHDWYTCPNVFRAVQDDLSAVARDDSPDSPLSTVSRGREVWAEEISCDFNSGESISEYARRRLRELQSVYVTASYERRFQPDVFVGDLVRLKYPKQGLDGIYEVTAQTMELGHGCRTSEEVKMT
ncbi:hypothetical protein [Eubacterium sp. AB3007]|uniref:hypothetical protein n=1 Tax=Eubacterium sp. AB3007 TaxID=1392487 RepID=UPI000488D698|nr:hypothetical protein [Eubacterium sp. AB3007]